MRFRIVQEGLRNIKKHSGAHSAQVRLRVNGSAVHLLISDQGAGFDLKELKMKEGLGVWRQNGALAGRSLPNSAAGKGTIIDVQIPLEQS